MADYMEIGRTQVIEEIGTQNTDKLIERTGVYGLSFLIGAILDAHYEKDLFGDGGIVQPAWLSNEGGREFDPGVRWVALLRIALQEIEEA